MRESHRFILHSTQAAEETAYSVILEAAGAVAYDEAFFVAPFVTETGVRMLLEITRQSSVTRVSWIVGLDGLITTPAALDAIAKSPLTGSLRGWTQISGGQFLHAKVYLLARRSGPRIVLYIGSANATGNGLSQNIEAGVLSTYGGKRALHVIRIFDAWLTKLRHAKNCTVLTQTEIEAYSSRYVPPKQKVRRVAKIVGAEQRSPRPVKPTGQFAWIEVAVRGGSSNQIEICKDMARFFTRGRNVSRVDFNLTEASGRTFRGNSYRYRHGNAGHRVEVNTELAQLLNLQKAATRKDIVLFRRTGTPRNLLIQLYPAKSKPAKKLVREGERDRRVQLTIFGRGGRRYYV